jgi:hypothetical protein
VLGKMSVNDIMGLNKVVIDDGLVDLVAKLGYPREFIIGSLRS